ncbi:MAG: RNA methyltransferase [Sediminibacterium sp.]|nr:RNA methyltransferase [Sediminibacterium sp.]
MLSKNEAKYIQSLFHKKQRQELGLFIAEGIKLVEELLNSDIVIKKIYATEDWELPSRKKVELTRVTADELQKISGLQTANKVLSIAEQPVLPQIKLVKNKWIMALDGIQDPGNMGTLIRIADWFGIDTIVASEDSVDAFNPKVVQSTMGGFARVNVHYTDIETFLRAAKRPVYGALLNGQSIYTTTTVNEGILLIGNESKGIHASLLPLISHPVSIPKIGGAESLNAAIAAGILISHLIKP